MRKTTDLALWLLAALAVLPCLSATAAETYVYESEGVRYPYTVEPTGENYTFQFEKNTGGEVARLRAARHVFRSVYGDDTIASKYTDAFMKEGATCFVFDARFYSYRVCFLPNDFSPDNRGRFWGFVSRLPNLMWFVTRNLLPAALVVGLMAWYFRRHM